MSNNDLAIVILAAGKGTRLKSSLAKVLHRAGGRTLVEQIVRACEPLKARETVVVVGHQADGDLVGNRNIDEPFGDTAQAAMIDGVAFQAVAGLEF